MEVGLGLASVLIDSSTIIEHMNVSMTALPSKWTGISRFCGRGEYSGQQRGKGSIYVVLLMAMCTDIFANADFSLLFFSYVIFDYANYWQNQI